MVRHYRKRADHHDLSAHHVKAPLESSSRAPPTAKTVAYGTVSTIPFKLVHATKTALYLKSVAAEIAVDHMSALVLDLLRRLETWCQLVYLPTTSPKGPPALGPFTISLVLHKRYSFQDHIKSSVDHFS